MSEKEKFIPDISGPDVAHDHAKDVINQQIFPNRWEMTLDQEFKGSRPKNKKARKKENETQI
jgi:hypothetical protein